MYHFLIYIETLIFMTFYVLVATCKNFLKIIGDSAEWYARKRVHWWQFSKVESLTREEFEEHQQPTKKSKKGKKS